MRTDLTSRNTLVFIVSFIVEQHCFHHNRLVLGSCLSVPCNAAGLTIPGIKIHVNNIHVSINQVDLCWRYRGRILRKIGPQNRLRICSIA